MILTLWGCHSPEISYPEGVTPIISDFRSMQGVNGKRRPERHQGIDIGGADGEEVLAIASGRVIKADHDTCWGPTILIDHGQDKHGDPLLALYGHVDQILVVEQDFVTRGQTIAKLGNRFLHLKCVSGVRHLHLQLGRRARAAYPQQSVIAWGHLRYLEDGRDALNPHKYWADGPYKVTCFEHGRMYPTGTITYPIKCP